MAVINVLIMRMPLMDYGSFRWFIKILYVAYCEVKARVEPTVFEALERTGSLTLLRVVCYKINYYYVRMCVVLYSVTIIHHILDRLFQPLRVLKF